MKSGNKRKMPITLKRLRTYGSSAAAQPGSSPMRCGIGLLVVSIVLILIFQSACSSKKTVTPLYATSPVRVALLPFNIPDGNDDLRWAAMAAPIMMAIISQHARDLEVISFWETMPVAKEAAGISRTITQGSAENAAKWLSVKWAIVGELAPAKRGVSAIVDFIPASSSQVPFRYFKTGKIDAVGSSFDNAFTQFLRYLLARPLERRQDEADMTSLRSLAEAMDREYGWFVDPEPGMAQETVAKLLNSNERLARFLFDPNIYPELKQSSDE